MPARVQSEPVKVPFPLVMNVTMPVGVVEVAEVSVTVAVHVEVWPEVIVTGAQDRLVLLEFAYTC